MLATTLHTCLQGPTQVVITVRVPSVSLRYDEPEAEEFDAADMRLRLDAHSLELSAALSNDSSSCKAQT